MTKKIYNSENGHLLNVNNLTKLSYFQIVITQSYRFKQRQETNGKKVLEWWLILFPLLLEGITFIYAICITHLIHIIPSNPLFSISLSYLTNGVPPALLCTVQKMAVKINFNRVWVQEFLYEPAKTL